MVTPRITNELRKKNPAGRHTRDGRPNIEPAMYFGIIVATNMDRQWNVLPITNPGNRAKNKPKWSRKSRKSCTEQSNADPVEIKRRNIHIISAGTIDELLRDGYNKRTDKPDRGQYRENHLVLA
jgi:hypothetical protein